MKYSLDTSSLVESWVRLFPPDVVPGFWKVMDDLIQSGVAVAIDEVRIELERQEDALLEWVKADGRDQMFQPIDAPVQTAVSEILDGHRRLVGTHKGRSGADPFVIGLAKVHGLMVVTTEGPGSPSKPHIPDVCHAHGIRCITPVELLREEGIVLS